MIPPSAASNFWSVTNVAAAVAAIGALGTAAFGLVDALKATPWINNTGFRRIHETIVALAPVTATPGLAINSLSQDKIIATLRANWGNGVDLGNQKLIAKSLLKLHLSPANADRVARATGVDEQLLTTVSQKIISGTALVSDESDVYARFDLIVTAMIDQVYQDADCAFRHRMQVLAMVVAVVLAVIADLLLRGGLSGMKPGEIAAAIGVGIIATPLAPVAKDLATALQTAVNAMQAVRRV